MKAVADLLRWALILGIWGAVTYFLWGVAWFWGAIWIVPGFILIMNVVGFATLPLYVLTGFSKRRFDEIERRDSN